MKKLAATCAALALVLTALPVAADHPGGATTRDMQRLQDELYNLDEALAALPAGHARHKEFSDRTEEVREDVTFLRVQIRRHQRNRGEGIGTSAADVNWVRDEIRTLHDDILTATNRRWSATTPLTLPEGTEMQVRLDTPLTSRTARPEDRFEASVIRAVSLDNRVAIPAGTKVRGTVVAAEPAERPAKGGKLDIAFNSLQLDDNTRVDVRSRVVSIHENIDRSQAGQKAGAGAALGALLGSVVGGRKGALLGLIVGGAGGAITTKGEEVELPEGTILTLRTERPVTVQRR